MQTLIYEPVNQNDMPPEGTPLFFGSYIYETPRWYYYNKEGKKIFIEMEYVGEEIIS